MKTMQHSLWCAVLLAFGTIQGIAATTNFYAPYNTSFNLAVGSPSAATVVGSVTSVTGFTNSIGGNTHNAAYFNGTTNFLDYGRADSYVPDFGNPAVGVKSNTFRLLYKPDYSGNPAFRANFLALGALAAADGIYLGQSDSTGTPGLRINFNTGGFKDTVLSAGSGFTWNSNTWYYVAGSLDASGSTFYIRALTNDAPAYTTSLSYSGVNWGNGGFGTIALRVGGRLLSNSEGARGTIDEVMIVNNAKWNTNDFNIDFGNIIPEPTSTVLALAGLGLIALRRYRL